MDKKVLAKEIVKIAKILVSAPRAEMREMVAEMLREHAGELRISLGAAKTLSKPLADIVSRHPDASAETLRAELEKVPEESFGDMNYSPNGKQKVLGIDGRGGTWKMLPGILRTDVGTGPAYRLRDAIGRISSAAKSAGYSVVRSPKMSGGSVVDALFGTRDTLLLSKRIFGDLESNMEFEVMREKGGFLLNAVADKSWAWIEDGSGALERQISKSGHPAFGGFAEFPAFKSVGFGDAKTDWVSFDVDADVAGEKRGVDAIVSQIAGRDREIESKKGDLRAEHARMTDEAA